ncbi:hypothetical protein HPB51_018490 [Rhipicephalus microplus]|uniref:Uncharacterized protein n=2 Tax=Rhipicephalus microplus TaxID=6941 RepID=A0A9J6EHU6_RHIMP|nr:hypothetical protein HPB51_018490 [Rhipicephalus microplus]
MGFFQVRTAPPVEITEIETGSPWPPKLSATARSGLPLAQEGMNKAAPVPGIAESVGDIKRRYEDTAQVLFLERREKQRPSSFLSYGETKKCYAYSGSGKPYVDVKEGVRADQQSFQSQICSIM